MLILAKRAYPPLRHYLQVKGTEITTMSISWFLIAGIIGLDFGRPTRPGQWLLLVGLPALVALLAYWVFSLWKAFAHLTHVYYLTSRRFYGFANGKPRRANFLRGSRIPVTGNFARPDIGQTSCITRIISHPPKGDGVERSRVFIASIATDMIMRSNVF